MSGGESSLIVNFLSGIQAFRLRADILCRLVFWAIANHRRIGPSLKLKYGHVPSNQGLLCFSICKAIQLRCYSKIDG